MAHFFFSVVIPTLNEANNVHSFLSNLEKQDFHNFELIVVDGKSSDSTQRKVVTAKKSFPIRLVVSPKANVSHQRNLGAKKARGKYIVFMDADTHFKPTFFSDLRQTLEVNPTDIFTCHMVPDEDKLLSHCITGVLSHYLSTARLLQSPGACGALTGCARKAFTKSGGYDPNCEYMEDGKFAREAFKCGCSVAILREPKFIFSMRRFRKYGYWNTIGTYINLNMKLFLGRQIFRGTEYPSI